MADWDIDPAGVQGVLTRTQTTASAFDGELTTIGSSMESAGGQTCSDIIGAALQGFAAAAKPQISGVVSRVSAALTGCGQAVTYYVQGDLTMAATAQANASSVADPTPPGGGGGENGGGHGPR